MVCGSRGLNKGLQDEDTWKQFCFYLDNYVDTWGGSSMLLKECKISGPKTCLLRSLLWFWAVHLFLRVVCFLICEIDKILIIMPPSLSHRISVVLNWDFNVKLCKPRQSTETGHQTQVSDTTMRSRGMRPDMIHPIAINCFVCVCVCFPSKT